MGNWTQLVSALKQDQSLDKLVVKIFINTNFQKNQEFQKELDKS
jgi:hypothetical protein